MRPIGQFRLSFKYFKIIMRLGIIGIQLYTITEIGGEITTHKSSKDREKFAKRAHEGVMAPEIANNTCCDGALVSTLTLSIPGNLLIVIFLRPLCFME